MSGQKKIPVGARALNNGSVKIAVGSSEPEAVCDQVRYSQCAPGNGAGRHTRRGATHRAGAISGVISWEADKV